MEETGGDVRARWGTAVGLSLAVVLLSVLNAVPLVVLPLAAALIALPLTPRWRWITLGALLWGLGVTLPGGDLEGVSRGWASMLAGGFLLATLWRPRWRVLARSLLAVAIAFVAGAVWLTATGGWQEVDTLVREHLGTVADHASGTLGAQAEDSAWFRGLASSMREMAVVQWRLFPGLLALQSLAALGLVSWTIARVRGDGRAFKPRPLREFRFNDQLVWMLIVGLVLLLLPLGAVATRMGYNALFFMGCLYALRGVGIFLFLGGAAPSVFMVVFGVLATVFLYPLVLTAAVLVGLGDTWLDVRGRAALAPRA